MLTTEQQGEAKELAVQIGALLGEAEKPIAVVAMALGLASAELIDFCPQEMRSTIEGFIQRITREAVVFLENKPKDDEDGAFTPTHHTVQ